MLGTITKPTPITFDVPVTQALLTTK